MAAPPADFDTLGVADIRTGILDGALSAVEVTQWHLDRIARHDSAINSVIELHSDPLSTAARLDEKVRAGAPAGPLHGVPVLVKDNIETGDGTMTTAGSLALDGHRASADADVVQRLRSAGALILGKANLAEWANFRSRAATNGWSSRGGLTRNPHDPARSAGGSSSGSAAATAAGFCVASLGTETDGSVVSPAAINGVVGVKPTVGLVGRRGIVPISPEQDTAGIVARSVADAALVLAAIGDPAPAGSGGAANPPTLRTDALAGARIGVARNLGPLHPGVETILDESVRAIEACGATVLDVAPLAAVAIRDLEYGAMAAEFRHALDAYLAALPADMPVRSLAALVAFNAENAARVMPHFGQDLLERALRAPALDDPAYLHMRGECARLSREQGVEGLLAEHRLDAIVAISASPAWPIDLINGDGPRYTSAYLAAIPGLPNVSVPAGFLRGLPVGLSFIAGRFQEQRLLTLAYAFEQATRCRRPPRLEAGTPAAIPAEAAAC